MKKRHVSPEILAAHHAAITHKYDVSKYAVFTSPVRRCACGRLKIEKVKP